MSHKILRAFSWTISIVSLFVVLLCAGLVSLIVGDWIMIHTGDRVLAWGLGFFIFFGFLCSLGAVIGIWIWLKAPTIYTVESGDSMNKILADISASERE